MNVQVIQQRLDSYNCQTDLEESHAMREITQEVVLAALGRGEFFKEALFQGGTCLRIFHGLNRFSEDLDFVLRRPTPHFQLKRHLGKLKDELAAYGYDLEITDKSKASVAVQKVFLKDNSLGKLLHLKRRQQTGPLAMIRIKLEVDINPPAESGTQVRYLDFPFVSGVAVQDMPSLFAGKMHALLCRNYVKGRDWYDFIWYTAQRTELNFAYLRAAINQVGPWQGQTLDTDRNWTRQSLQQKIQSLDWPRVAMDVRRFVPEREQPSLELWNKKLFLGQLDKLDW